MAFLYKFSFILLGLAISSSSFASVTIKPAKYESSYGHVKVTSVMSESMTFELENASNAGDQCELTGQADKESENSYLFKDKNGCRIKFLFKDANILSVDSEDACQRSCGPSAGMGGEFQIKPSECSEVALKEARKDFQIKYDSKKYTESVSILETKIKTCKLFIATEELAALRSDLSIAALRAGNKLMCLDQIKTARAENPNLLPDSLKNLPDSNVYNKLKKIGNALIFNEKKCLAK